MTPFSVVPPPAAVPTLPAPAKDRWQPLRSGLLNLYKYDHEEFWYEDGHLLLRGNNGTGKSRVLALQLPFLLDGQTLPSRVEPDGDPAKRMEWNLLMGKHEDRVGYTWLELGRRSGPGREELVTLGCGLSATQGQTGVDSWFFLTTLRIGEGLFLQGQGGQPLSRERLREALGTEGEVFKTAQAYRDAVDEKLFRLGRRRYEALVGLLIQLRKPQLSRALDQAQLAGALREALPPLPQKVVDDIAESFRALEHERSELQSFHAAADAVDRFLETYWRYVQVAVRQRSDAVRSAHTGYDDGQRALRRAEQSLAERTAAAGLAERELDEQRLARAAAQAEASALEESEASRDAKALADRKRRAEAAAEAERSARDDAAQAGQVLEARAEALEAARRSSADAERSVERSGELAGAAAAEAAFEARWPELRAELARDGEGDRGAGALERLLGDRRRALAVLERLTSALDDARGRLGTAAAEQQARASELEEALSAEAEDQRRLGAAREALLSSLEGWHASLRALDAGPLEALESLVSRWCDARSGPFPLESLVRERHAEVVARTGQEQAAREHRLSQVAAAIEQGQQQRRKWIEGQTLPPPRPHTRSGEARAEGTPGAPLWRVCDFHPEVPAEARAGLEAALEASGLLDAWIGPEGLRLPPGTHDVLLRGGGALPEGVPRLSDWLVPAVDPADAGARHLGEAAVRGVLDAIGGREGASEHWVDPRGAFRLGPLTGSWAKPSAEHLGHAAREAARRAAIARIEEELAALGEERQRLERELQGLGDRLRRAGREAQEAPSGDEVRSAGLRLERSAELVQGRRTRLAEAESRLAAARAKAEAAERELGAAAGDLGLEAWTLRLGELKERTERFRGAAERLREVVGKALAARREEARCAREAGEAQAARERAAARLRRAAEEAAEAGSAYDVLYQAVGASVEEVSRKLGDAKRRARAAADRELELTGALGTLRGACAAAEAEIAAARTGLQRAAELRGAAIDALARLAGLGFLGLAAPSLGLAAAGEWTPTRALEIARALEDALAAEKVDHSAEAWDRLGNQMQARFQTLTTELGHSGLFQPDAAMPDGVFHVRVAFQNRALGTDELRAVLADEVLQRQTLLDQRERELLENHLLGEVASHLHELLHEAERWVRAVNDELERCSTSTGMALSFRWEPIAEGPSGLPEARRLLLRNQATWSPEQRGAVGRFLKAQIDRARAEAPEASWQEHLSLAFDYRAWHDFSVHRYQDGRWQKLTRRTHGTGSGGEKAIALTLPQFAAAAAHYGSAAPTAPRLILLDEAFVGIDSDMRSKCMGLLASFDLDFMMTSEREWGCYPTLPGVAICQLTGRAGIDAVHVTRFVWNGRARVPAEVAHPPARAPRGEA